MYCYKITRDGRILSTRSLREMTLYDAIVEGQKALIEQPEIDERDSIEIWNGTRLIYAD